MPNIEYILVNPNGINIDSNLYIYNPPNTSSTFTYVLPLIVCDGMRFKFVRNDTDDTSTLTIQSTSPDLILIGPTLVPSYILKSSSNVVFISKNNTWYSQEKSSNVFSSSGSLMSSAFSSNNGVTFLNYPNGTSVITRFAYRGSNVRIVEKIIMSFIAYSSVTFDLKRLDNISVLNSPVVFNSPLGVLTFFEIPKSSINIANLPTINTALVFYVTTSGNNQLSLYSIIVR